MRGGRSRAGAGSPFEWFPEIGYGRPPFAAFAAGPWQCTAGAQGVIPGIFGWMDPATGLVGNIEVEGGLLGFVLPVFNMYNWQRAFTMPPPGAPVRPGFPVGGYATPLQPQVNPPPYSQIVLRPGMACVLAVAGEFNTRFPQGAQVGQPVWTDPESGLPYAANLGGNYVETPYQIAQSVECGGLARISSFLPSLTLQNALITQSGASFITQDGQIIVTG